MMLRIDDDETISILHYGCQLLYGRVYPRVPAKYLISASRRGSFVWAKPVFRPSVLTDQEEKQGNGIWIGTHVQG